MARSPIEGNFEISGYEISVDFMTSSSRTPPPSGPRQIHIAYPRDRHTQNGDPKRWSDAQRGVICRRCRPQRQMIGSYPRWSRHWRRRRQSWWGCTVALVAYPSLFPTVTPNHGLRSARIALEHEDVWLSIDMRRECRACACLLQNIIVASQLAHEHS